MNNQTRIAVIGVGYLGRIHAKIYHEMPDVDLVAVVDTNKSTVEEVAEKNCCQGFSDAAELIGKVDAVSVVVPTSLHLPVSRIFLENGIHVMLEKPIATTVDESTEIVELAKYNKALLQIGHLERFNAGVMKLAELANDPRFIEVHRLGEFVERATDVDVVTDLMIHDIDIVLSLVNSKIKSVVATGTHIITDHVDIANARLDFENGAVANFTASRVSRNQFRRIRVFSEHSYLGLNFKDQQLEKIKPGEIKPGKKFPELLFENIEVTPQLPLNAELAYFIDCVTNNRQPLVDGNAGLVAVRVAEMVRQKISQSVG